MRVDKPFPLPRRKGCGAGWVGCDQSERVQFESACLVVRKWCDGIEAVEPWEPDVWNAATYIMSL
jgi:hypothetical protein